VLGLVFSATDLGVLDRAALAIDYETVLVQDAATLPFQFYGRSSSMEYAGMPALEIDAMSISMGYDAFRMQFNWTESCDPTETALNNAGRIAFNQTECTLGADPDKTIFGFELNRYRSGSFSVTFVVTGDYLINLVPYEDFEFTLLVSIEGTPPPVYHSLQLYDSAFHPDGNELVYVSVFNVPAFSSIQMRVYDPMVPFILMERTVSDDLAFQNLVFLTVPQPNPGLDMGYDVNINTTIAGEKVDQFQILTNVYEPPPPVSFEDRPEVPANATTVEIQIFYPNQDMPTTMNLSEAVYASIGSTMTAYYIYTNYMDERSEMVGRRGLLHFFARQQATPGTFAVYKSIIADGEQDAARINFQDYFDSGGFASDIGAGDDPILIDIVTELPRLSSTAGEIMLATTTSLVVASIVAVTAVQATTTVIGAGAGAATTALNMGFQMGGLMGGNAIGIGGTTGGTVVGQSAPLPQPTSNPASTIHQAAGLNAVGFVNVPLQGDLLQTAKQMGFINGFLVKSPFGGSGNDTNTQAASLAMVAVAGRKLAGVDNFYDIYEDDLNGIFEAQLFYLGTIFSCLVLLHGVLYFALRGPKNRRRQSIALNIMTKIEIVFFNIAHMGVFIGGFLVLSSSEQSTGRKLAAVFVILIFGIGYPVVVSCLLIFKVRPYMNTDWLTHYWYRYVLLGGWPCFERFSEVELDAIEDTWRQGNTKRENTEFFYVERKHRRFSGIWFSRSTTRLRYGDFFESYKGQYYMFMVFELTMAALNGTAVGAFTKVPEVQVGVLCAVNILELLVIIWLLPFNDFFEQVIQVIVAMLNTSNTFCLVVMLRVDELDPKASKISDAILWMNITAILLGVFYTLYTICEVLYQTRHMLWSWLKRKCCSCFRRGSDDDEAISEDSGTMRTETTWSDFSMSDAEEVFQVDVGGEREMPETVEDEEKFLMEFYYGKAES